MRYCRLCNRSKQFPNDVVAYVEQYIEALPEQNRTPIEEYEKRIRTCASCKYLTSGMCGACGCFVEVRAAVNVRECPYGYWNSI